MPKTTGRALVLTGLFGSVLCLAIYFWCLARYNQETNFLISHTPAEWILYPIAPAGGTHTSIDVNTTFRRSFVLQDIPKTATLTVRAMKHWTLTLNGIPIMPPEALDGRWKKPTVMTVAPQLHPGTNEIVVTVLNTNGPPALWLALELDHQQLNSDSNWSAQLWDSVVCPAALATSPPTINSGNRMLMRQTPMDGFRRHGIFFVGATAISALLFSALRRLQRRHGDFFASDEFALCAVALMVLLWVALYCNNLRALSSSDGFDALDHLNYIQRVQNGPGLPLANEGWQMYQPPLYYITSATAMEVASPATVHGKATVARILGLGIGIAQFTLTFLSLRLIFPTRPGMQLFGLVLAALVPAHLYISQYVTNESLAAMLVTASFYLCLRIVIRNRDSWRIFLAVGICFGAALLAKVTAVLAAPFIAVALLNPAVLREPAIRGRWLARTCAAAAACLAVCGWHYYRTWSHFGSPLAGNWNSSVWRPWWMEPGFRTWSYFFRFGECLTHPWFSGLNGFADGLYSTLWGDSLLGGRVAIEFRPAWNYDLMAAGFLLALIPSLFIAAGALSAVKSLVRQPGRVWALLVGVPLATLSALIYMNLKVPNYGEAKAFYGLLAVMPICAFGALGHEVLKRLGKPFYSVAITLFGVWAMNTYATFWIRTDTALSRSHMAFGAAQDGRDTEAFQHYSEAIRLAPQNVEVKSMMAMDLSRWNRTNEIHSIAAQAAKDPLVDGGDHFSLAAILGLDGQLDAAVAEARRSVEIAGDNPLAYEALCEWQCRAGHYAEAISAGREGERVNPFSASLHFDLGQAFAALNDQTNAADHFRITTQLRPEWPAASDRFGMSLTALGRLDEATNLFWQALQLAPQEPTYRFHLASALAGLGDAPGEIRQYREILRTNPKFVPALESLAWRLATSPNPELWDGAEAMKFAALAIQVGGTNHTQFSATLAAAYARAGQFEEADETIRKALDMAEPAGQTDVAAFDQKLLKLFQSGQPYVDETPRKPVISADAEFGKAK